MNKTIKASRAITDETLKKCDTLLEALETELAKVMNLPVANEESAQDIIDFMIKTTTLKIDEIHNRDVFVYSSEIQMHFETRKAALTNLITF